MKISSSTKYEEFARVEKYVRPSDKEAIKAAAERKYGAMADLAFGMYWSICNGDEKAVKSVLGEMKSPSVLQVYWLQRVREYTNEFTDTLKALQVPQTAHEMQASEGMKKSTFAESILVFVRAYFGLQSFRDAEQITLGEIIIAKKDAYNTAMFQRRLSKIQLNEIKRK